MSVTDVYVLDLVFWSADPWSWLSANQAWRVCQQKLMACQLEAECYRQQLYCSSVWLSNDWGAYARIRFELSNSTLLPVPGWWTSPVPHQQEWELCWALIKQIDIDRVRPVVSCGTLYRPWCGTEQSWVHVSKQQRHQHSTPCQQHRSRHQNNITRQALNSTMHDRQTNRQCSENTSAPYWTNQHGWCM